MFFIRNFDQAIVLQVESMAGIGPGPLQARSNFLLSENELRPKRKPWPHNTSVAELTEKFYFS